MKKIVYDYETKEGVVMDYGENDWEAHNAILNELANLVPNQVAMWQFRAVLKQKNLYDIVNQYITDSDNIALDSMWEYSQVVERNSGLIDNLINNLNITSEEFDIIFREASVLTV